jgi:hypothetical protein
MDLDLQHFMFCFAALGGFCSWYSLSVRLSYGFFAETEASKMVHLRLWSLLLFFSALLQHGSLALSEFMPFLEVCAALDSFIKLANTSIKAFLVGLICPHEGGFAIKLTEKIEDIVTVLFLPLYFALSGLSTNLGLLNDGITWGYVVGVIAVAFSGKIIGGTLAAKACKLVWRESFTIGVLMSCKGLVELIVLVSFTCHNHTA